MQIQALLLSLASVVIAVPAPAPVAEPQFSLCFDDGDCLFSGGGKLKCSNGQCVTPPAGSPEAALASALAGLGAGILPSGLPTSFGKRETEQ
ncbi:hypothetical protein AMS68_006774 [Peltaster fructicola]|uniref:Extracellular membrane protein CFEM domain-containing protein n=1 Tax=Peltaster fructicola TaxID=286661 RepID=A0A6H0Y2M9_9PEZI|nr:hypothetical protein AMS68_006774 [Peltaster fructicola]